MSLLSFGSHLLKSQLLVLFLFKVNTCFPLAALKFFILRLMFSNLSMTCLGIVFLRVYSIGGSLSFLNLLSDVLNQIWQMPGYCCSSLVCDELFFCCCFQDDLCDCDVPKCGSLWLVLLGVR